MKTKIRYSILSTIIALFLSVPYCVAQNSADSLDYRIETKDGNIYIGKILTQDSEKIIFNTDNLGEIRIKKDDVKKIQAIDTNRIKNGNYWFNNPQATRYFFSPNAYGLRKGEGYYQNVWVMVNSFAVGISDYVSVGGGLIPLFLFGGAPTPVWFTPKVSIPISRENVGLGAGALVGTVLGEENTGFALFYGISTFGSKDKNVSLGLGYGFAGDSWAQSPMINLNVMLRAGARGYFISENYFVKIEGETAIFLSLGGRYIIKDSGIDYGLIVPIVGGMNEFIVLPWLGMTIPFGNKPSLQTN